MFHKTEIGTTTASLHMNMHTHFPLQTVSELPAKKEDANAKVLWRNKN